MIRDLLTVSAARALGREATAELRTVFSGERIGLARRLESLAHLYVGAVMLTGYALVYVAPPLLLLAWLAHAAL